MKRSSKIFALSIAVLLIPVVSVCCDLCGTYFGVFPMENQNTFSIVHRFRVYNGYSALNQNGSLFPSGAYRYVQPPSALHGPAPTGDLRSASDYESYKRIELTGKYFVHERIQAEFVLPVVNNKSKSIGSNANVWSLGDISLSISYRLMQSPAEKEFRHRMLVGLGVKLPTGSSNSSYDDGDRLPLRMQPGTGSYDALATITYAASYKSWLCGFTSRNRFSTSNEYYEWLAPMTKNTLIVTRTFVKNSWKFYPQLQIYQELMSGMRENGNLIAGTKVNNLLGGPGLEVYFGKFGIGVCAQFPIYQYVYYRNMEMTWRLMVGLSYNFKSEKYMLQ